MSDLLFHEDAWEEYIYWRKYDDKMAKKIEKLLKDISRTPFTGIGKPEPLKGGLSGFWSRRIDDERRLIYNVSGNVIEIVSCKGHYGD